MGRQLTQRVRFADPGVVVVRTGPLPPVADDAVLVASCVSAISAGTEMLVYRGQMPAQMAVDSTIGALAGTFSYPLSYGYAAVGRIIACGDKVTKWRSGQLVFAFQPHASHFLVQPDDLMAVPDGVSAESAAFLPNMETAVSFVMDARPVIGEQTIVFGQGIVGLLTTMLLADMSPGKLVTVDASPLRRKWSLTLGAHVALDPFSAEYPAQLHDSLPDGADLAVELSGNPDALDLAVDAVGYGGRVVIGSWYGTKPVTLNLGGAFHRNHIQLISSQVSTLGPQWRGRWTKDRRFALAWQLLARHNPARLISHRFPIERAPEAYALLDQHSAETVQVILTYETN
ncbi:MAG: zinc-binding alcohol dehydrogenase [Anaerolineae bacterium]|nr:zinc-binding alcohol dehydrogenase [Anaerolineae bacterium]MCO5206413.1 zinc-binding alcohol dehydrogenase [Anaerolineae bacterium]